MFHPALFKNTKFKTSTFIQTTHDNEPYFRVQTPSPTSTKLRTVLISEARLRNLLRNALVSRERETYEQATTYMDASPSPTAPSTPYISEAFLDLFFSKLPQELRDMVYSCLQPTHDIFILQPPHLFPYSDFALPEKTAPLSPVPRVASPSTHTVLLQHNVGAHFFTSNTFYARYRYTSALHTFLTTAFADSTCVPAHHMRRLNVLLGAPTSAEDDGALDGEVAEYEWGALFPDARNGKCSMYRERLEGDFGALGEILGKERCEVDVMMMDVYDDGHAIAAVEWVKGWVRGVNEKGGRVRLREEWP